MKKRVIKKKDSELPKGFVLVITVVPKDGKCHAQSFFRGKEFRGSGETNIDALRSIFTILRDQGDVDRH